MDMDYQKGVARLLQQVESSNPYHLEVLALQSRLTENLRRERMFGSTETLRAEKAEILYSLNNIALITAGMSFNDLSLIGQASERRSEISKVEDLATSIRRSYSTLQHNENMLRSAKDTRERARINQLISDLRTSTSSDITEYLALSKNLGLSVENDIRHIASALKLSIKTPAEALTGFDERAELRDALLKSFNLAELRILCFDLGVDWEELPDSTLTMQVRELIGYMERRRRLPELITAIREARPGVI